MNHRRMSGRPCRILPAAAVVACLVVLAGCAAPRAFMRELDASHDTIGRDIAYVVDQADRAFGESRVEDRLRIVQAKLGPQLEWRLNHGTSFSFPVSLRAPFPALERWANIFVQFNSASDTYSTASDAAVALDKNKAFTLAWISNLSELVDTGIKANGYWIGGMQAAVRPFIRWDKAFDPYHFFVETQVYYKTDDLFGGQISLQVDRKLTDDSFLRVVTTTEYHQGMTGTDQSQVLLYRRPLFGKSYLSTELGTSWNTGSPPLREDDDDNAYFFLRTTGKLGRSWIEYELRPEMFYVWKHEKPWEYGLKLEIRFLYEAFLHGV